jgi:hypothetical protein
MEAAPHVFDTEVGMGRIDTAIIVVAALVSLASCRPVDKLGFTPVVGLVTLDGKPLERGEIRFVPDAGQGNSGPQSIGTLGPGGAFTLFGPGGRVGAVPGPHRVYLSMPVQEGPPEPPIEVDGKVVARDEAEHTQPLSAPGSSRSTVPGKYRAPETSGLTASVARGEPARLEFELVSSPARK